MPKLNKKQLIESLNSFEVEIPKGATVRDLEKLLVKAEKAKEKEKEEKVTPTDEETTDDKAESEETRLKPPSEQLEVKEPESDKVEGDYLRQYQYKKVDGNPTVGGPETDPDLGSKAETMKKFMLSQPKVKIFIPRAEGESPKVMAYVNLDGYRLDLPKQTYLELPLNVAEVIMDSQKQQVEALKPYLIDRDKKTKEALE